MPSGSSAMASARPVLVPVLVTQTKSVLLFSAPGQLQACRSISSTGAGSTTTGTASRCSSISVPAEMLAVIWPPADDSSARTLKPKVNDSPGRSPRSVLHEMVLDRFWQLTDGEPGGWASTSDRLCGTVGAGSADIAPGSCAETPDGSASTAVTGFESPEPLLLTVIGRSTGSPPATSWIGSPGPEALSTGMAVGGGVGAGGDGSGAGGVGFGAGGGFCGDGGSGACGSGGFGGSGGCTAAGGGEAAIGTVCSVPEVMAMATAAASTAVATPAVTAWRGPALAAPAAPAAPEALPAASAAADAPPEEETAR